MTINHTGPYWQLSVAKYCGNPVYYSILYAPIWSYEFLKLKYRITNTASATPAALQSTALLQLPGRGYLSVCPMTSQDATDRCGTLFQIYTDKFQAIIYKSFKQKNTNEVASWRQPVG